MLNWNRIIEVDVIINSITYTFANDSSKDKNYEIEFDVNVFGSAQPANCLVKFYNLSVDLIKNIQNNSEIYVIIKAGYQDTGLFILGSGVVFSKKITVNIPDIEIELMFSPSMDLEYENKSQKFYKSGETLGSIIKDILSEYKNEIEIDSNVENQTFDHTFVYNGLPIQSVLKICKKNNLNIAFEKNKIKIVDSEFGSSKSKLFKLNKENGLIGLPVIRQDGGLDINILLNPMIEIFDFVQVEIKKDNYIPTNSKANPSIFELYQNPIQKYTVFNIKHTGGSHRNDYYTKLETRMI